MADLDTVAASLWDENERRLADKWGGYPLPWSEAPDGDRRAYIERAQAACSPPEEGTNG